MIIGFQLILWFASGTLMSFLPIDKVHGDHLVDRKTVAAIPASAKFADIGQIVRAAGRPVDTVTVKMLLGRPVIETTSTKGLQLFDAQTGSPISLVTAQQAQKIALDAWHAGGKPQAVVNRVTDESTEYRGALPAWRVRLADPDHTRVFVTETGKIAAVRTGTWRLYDFFWGLHIMDWKNHENFNTPWLLGFAIGGMVLGLAGTVLLVMRWPRRRRRRPAYTEAGQAR